MRQDRLGPDIWPESVFVDKSPLRCWKCHPLNGARFSQRPASRLQIQTNCRRSESSLGDGGEADHGDGFALAVRDGVAHVGVDQGLVAGVVVANDEFIPEPTDSHSYLTPALIPYKSLICLKNVL